MCVKTKGDNKFSAPDVAKKIQERHAQNRKAADEAGGLKIKKKK
jgi:hypothetical protein